MYSDIIMSSAVGIFALKYLRMLSNFDSLKVLSSLAHNDNNCAIYSIFKADGLPVVVVTLIGYNENKIIKYQRILFSVLRALCVSVVQIRTGQINSYQVSMISTYGHASRRAKWRSSA